MKLPNIFKRNSPTLVETITETLKDTEFRELIKLQVSELARHKRLELKQRTEDKYGFFKHQLDHGIVIKAESYDEWLYVKYMVEEVYKNE